MEDYDFFKIPEEKISETKEDQKIEEKLPKCKKCESELQKRNYGYYCNLCKKKFDKELNIIEVKKIKKKIIPDPNYSFLIKVLDRFIKQYRRDFNQVKDRIHAEELEGFKNFVIGLYQKRIIFNKINNRKESKEDILQFISKDYSIDIAVLEKVNFD